MREAGTPSLASRLPAVGTTVFTRMSALAQEHGAVNLGQGFPDFACEPQLTDMVADAMRAGFNQYPMMSGAPVLRHAIAEVSEAGWAPDVALSVAEGPSEYLFGEETALLEVINGRPPNWQ